MSVFKNEIITVKGYNRLENKIMYPIYEDTIVELKGEFRSEGNLKSRIYFGLHCFREDDSEIRREDINRTNESLLITSINTDGKTITLNKKPETWNNSEDSGSQVYRKLIGIYFDGNITHLPDYIIESPAYKKYENNIINLNNEIPRDIIKKIIPFTTKVMNHNSGNGNSYDYSAASGCYVPEKWTQYKAVYNEFSEGYGDIKGKFRLGRKKVSPFVLANYSQNEDSILEIRNIKIISTNKPKFI